MTDQFGVIRQVAYVVEDMNQALKYWIDFLGAGPFYMFEHSQMDDQKYRGGGAACIADDFAWKILNLSIEEIFFIEVFNEECIHMGCKTSKKINYSR